jgi:ribosomal protein L11 methyltransferase
MEWIKASVSTNTEGVEDVFAVLLSCGINGAQIIDPSDLQRILAEEPRQWDYVDESLLNASGGSEAYVEFYLTPDAAGHEILSQVNAQLLSLKHRNEDNALGKLELTFESADDEAWLYEWKKHYKPFRVGKAVVIVPVWERYEAMRGDVVFTIDPGSVFGTGLHQTTQLCIEAMEDYVASGGLVMDLGCGSGILSIISLLLGAAEVFACDFDPAASIATRENARRNPVSQNALTVVNGDIFEIDMTAVKPRDVVIANIVADVIIRLAPAVKNYLKPNGVFISSGIIDERVFDVKQSLASNGLKLESELQRDGWYCLVSRYA